MFLKLKNLPLTNHHIIPPSQGDAVKSDKKLKKKRKFIFLNANFSEIAKVAPALLVGDGCTSNRK